jgi:hypothetical protein
MSEQMDQAENEQDHRPPHPRGPQHQIRQYPWKIKKDPVAASAYERMTLPEYPLWCVLGITVRWFSAPGKLLRMEGNWFIAKRPHGPTSVHGFVHIHVVSSSHAHGC